MAGLAADEERMETSPPSFFCVFLSLAMRGMRLRRDLAFCLRIWLLSVLVAFPTSCCNTMYEDTSLNSWREAPFWRRIWSSLLSAVLNSWMTEVDPAMLK